MELNEAERSAVNWSRFTIKIGIQNGEQDGVLRFSRTELGILRHLLMKEIAGEVVATASDNFNKLAKIVSEMERWMIEHGAR